MCTSGFNVLLVHKTGSKRGDCFYWYYPSNKSHCASGPMHCKYLFLAPAAVADTVPVRVAWAEGRSSMEGFIGSVEDPLRVALQVHWQGLVGELWAEWVNPNELHSPGRCVVPYTEECHLMVELCSCDQTRASRGAYNRFGCFQRVQP